jgi:hypothetical protein
MWRILFVFLLATTAALTFIATLQNAVAFHGEDGKAVLEKLQTQLARKNADRVER